VKQDHIEKMNGVYHAQSIVQLASMKIIVPHAIIVQFYGVTYALHNVHQIPTKRMVNVCHAMDVHHVAMQQIVQVAIKARS